MIVPTRKKLSRTFLTVLIPASMLLLATTYIFLYSGAIDSTKAHIMENVNAEFLHHYENRDFATLSKLVEDELFEVLDRDGKVIIKVRSVIKHKPSLNKAYLESAFSGRSEYEIVKGEDHKYMIFYLPLDKGHVLRVTGSMEELDAIQRDYLKLMLVMLPVLLMVSYFLSRYMVNQAFKPIERLMKYQETFSSNLTHELNSPLTAIKGNIEVTLKKERPASEYRQALKAALRNINNITDLLGNLYLLSTSDLKELDMYKEKVDMTSMINGIMEHYEPAIFAKKIKLETSLHENAFCRCDASLIKRAVENLIDNAVKYTSRDGLIRVSTSRSRDSFSMTVSNTCEGVILDEYRNFFKLFYRGQNSMNMNVKGSGMGLYIVKYIIDSHGGKISAWFDHGVLSLTMDMPFKDK